MLKHIGKHNDRKVAVLYHQVPNEDHMCLLVYSDLLPRMVHDSVMKELESPTGQQAKDLAEALFRVMMPDGRNILEVVHKEGFMKKVNTNQVIMTPTPATKIRLDELNTILSEMAKGEDAVKRLADIDSQTGLQKKKRDNTVQREVGEPAKVAKKENYIPPLQAGPNDVLTDEAIATQQRRQAEVMRKDAASLLNEAAVLEQEAAKLSPLVETPVVKEKAKPGRPKGSNVKSKEAAQA